MKALLRFDSARLFLCRAQAVLPEFTLNSHNASLVAQICWRLDGIPLAIELAAARSASMDLIQINSRLEHSFRLLTGSNRATIERHRTLRAAIDWSYALLSTPEQILLGRLSVFTGSFTLEAIEGICTGENLVTQNHNIEIIERVEIPDIVAQLVNKSLVMVDQLQGQRARYRLLAMIHQYAHEKLSESGEYQHLREQHLAWFVAHAEILHPGLLSGERLVLDHEMIEDLDNFASALSWAQDSGADPQVGLRLAIALSPLLMHRGQYYKLHTWLEKNMLEAAKQAELRLDLLCNALFFLGMLDIFLGNEHSTLAHADKMIDLCKNGGAEVNIFHADALILKGWVHALRFGELETGLSFFSQAENWLREAKSIARWDLALCLSYKSWTLQYLGELDSAQNCAEESWRLTMETGDIWSGRGLINLGDIAFARKEYIKAIEHYQRALTLSQQSGQANLQASILKKLGRVENAQTKHQSAKQQLIKGLTIMDGCGDRFNSFQMIGELAFNEMDWGKTLPDLPAHSHFIQATHLLGKYQDLMEKLHVPVFTEHRQEYELAVSFLGGKLTPTVFKINIDEGRRKSVHQFLRKHDFVELIE